MRVYFARTVRAHMRDGAWFRLNGGSWAVVRFSGTEPLLRTYAEAPVEATLDAIIADVRALVGV